MYWHGVLYIHTYIGTIEFSYVTLVLLEHFLLITVCVTPVGMRGEPLLSTIIVTRMSMENRTPSPHVLSLCHCFCWVWMSVSTVTLFWSSSALFPLFLYAPLLVSLAFCLKAYVPLNVVWLILILLTYFYTR